MMNGNVMTLEEKLYAMRMVDLAAFAEKHGIKINKKGSKAIAIDKILMEMDDEPEAVESEIVKPKEIKNTKDFLKAVGDILDGKPVEKPEEKPADLKKDEQPKPVSTDEKPAPKRGALLTYQGKSQNICAWAKELGKSANTLYGRLYKLGWSVEDAFTK